MAVRSRLVGQSCPVLYFCRFPRGDNMMRIIQWCSALLLVLSAVSAVDAQTTTGSVFGNVTDASGAVLAGVSVRIASPATGASRETETDSVGAFQFDGVPPARSVMTLEVWGFRS